MTQLRDQSVDVFLSFVHNRSQVLHFEYPKDVLSCDEINKPKLSSQDKFKTEELHLYYLSE